MSYFDRMTTTSSILAEASDSGAMKPIAPNTELIIDCLAQLNALSPSRELIATLKRDLDTTRHALLSCTAEYLVYETKGGLRLIQLEEGYHTLVKLPESHQDPGVHVMDVGFCPIPSPPKTVFYAVASDGSLNVFEIVHVVGEDEFANSVSLVLRIEQGDFIKASWNPSSLELAVMSRERIYAFPFDAILSELGSGKTVTLAQFTALSDVLSLSHVDGQATSLAWSVSEMLAFGSSAGQVCVFNYRASSQSTSLFSAHEGPVTTLAWLDEQLLLSMSDAEKMLKLWSNTQGVWECLQSIRFDNVSLDACLNAWVTEGFTLVSTTDPSKIYVFESEMDNTFTLMGEISLDGMPLSMATDATFEYSLDMFVLTDKMIEVITLQDMKTVEPATTNADGGRNRSSSEVQADMSASESMAVNMADSTASIAAVPELDMDSTEKVEQVSNEEHSASSHNTSIKEEVSTDRQVQFTLPDDFEKRVEDAVKKSQLAMVPTVADAVVDRCLKEFAVHIQAAVQKGIQKALAKPDTLKPLAESISSVQDSLSQSFDAKLKAQSKVVRQDLQSATTSIIASVDQLNKQIGTLIQKRDKTPVTSDNGPLTVLANQQLIIMEQLKVLLQMQAAQKKPAVIGMPVDPLAQIKGSIDADLGQSRFESAFTKALEGSNPDLIDYVLEKTSIDAVFAQGHTVLSQPVLLMLVNVLSGLVDADEENVQRKLDWIQEAVMAVEPNHPLTRSHLAPVMSRLLHSLDELSQSNLAAPQMRSIKILGRIAHSILK